MTSPTPALRRSFKSHKPVPRGARLEARIPRVKAVRLGVVLALVSALLAGCTTHKPSLNGTVSGQLVIQVDGNFATPASGTVAVHKVAVYRNTMEATAVAQSAVGPDGKFQFVLPAGRYVILGRTPHFTGLTDENGNGCFSSFIVKSGDVLRVIAVCRLP